MGENRSKKFCLDCHQTVSHSTFRQHKNRFYSTWENKWQMVDSDAYDVYEGNYEFRLYINTPMNLSH